ncbi:MAG: YfhO family protein, partial [Clostridia bacterium]|nr:YfhO family protein [Clostridia bacterium]
MVIISDVINFSPFGNISPLVADTSVQFEVYVSYLKSVFFSDNDLFYTFSKTLGGDMAGFSFYYLGNPFLYLLVFLPNEWMPAGILGVIILLMALSSLNFNIMLNKIYGFRWSSLMFAVSYAFMGYFTAYYNFIIYFNNIMLLPLIILGLYEMVIKEKISYKYIIFLAASIITNYYIGYMTCIFCVLFFIYLMVTAKTDAKNKNKIKLLIIRFTWESLLAAVISSAALFTVVNSLMSGQKLTDDYGFKLAWGTNFKLQDVFSGLYSIAFNGNISDGLPIIYVGTLTVVFSVLFFLNKEIKIKERIAAGVLIILLVLSFWIKFLNRIWHGLAETVGFPYRYSFFLSFFLLFIAYKAFILMKQGTRKYHTLIVLGLYALYSLYMVLSNSECVFVPQIILTGAFLCMYLTGIYAICYKREYMYPVTIGFFMILSFDLILNAHYSITKYYDFSKEDVNTVEYYDDYCTLLSEIKRTVYEDDGRDGAIFRMDKL